MSAVRRRGAGDPTDPEAVAAALISTEQAVALLRKYRLLAAWRQSKDSGDHPPVPVPAPTGAQADAPPPSSRATDAPGPMAGAPADRAAMRALSGEFPGALRELDVLGLPEISRRIVRLTLLLNGTAQSTAARPGANATIQNRRSRHRPDDDRFDEAETGEAGDDDLWMPLIAAYHGLMRVALAVKRASARTRAVSPHAVANALAAVQASCGFSVGESFVRAAVRPPGGRLAVVVLTELAQRFGLPATQISRLLFPPRRPAPYHLPS